MPDFIYDKDLYHIDVIDNDEPLVNIKDFSDDIIVKLEPESLSFFGENVGFLRKSVALKLAGIQKRLVGLRLVLCDCYRPVELQKILFDNFLKELRLVHPFWSLEELSLECSKFVAPVIDGVVPPHSTGGAFDITLEKDGRLVDMGTVLGDLSLKSSSDDVMIVGSARKNRQFLAKILIDEGFVNYPLEWWHWSYGDRTWAFYKKEAVSFYGKVDWKGAR